MSIQRTAADVGIGNYGLGMAWGPAYTLLRRWTDLGPVSAGLLVGAA
ncbi:MAG: hypothetical protein IRY88_02570, partial [Rubrobacteraceae bacterium]|nr:hypothetical protein [Rubrobacteraceae bacterium]